MGNSWSRRIFGLHYGLIFRFIWCYGHPPENPRSQIARVLGTVVIMGTLVGLYGIFQHFGHDFLNITESSGGGPSRVTIFMGNAIFAGAVLSLTVPATLLASGLVFNPEHWGNLGPLDRMESWYRDTIFTFLLSAMLVVQLLGLMFTFNRGPWGGTIVSMVVLLGVIAVFLVDNY